MYKLDTDNRIGWDGSTTLDVDNWLHRWSTVLLICSLPQDDGLQVWTIIGISQGGYVFKNMPASSTALGTCATSPTFLLGQSTNIQISPFRIQLLIQLAS